jgi:hypothetical protein
VFERLLWKVDQLDDGVRRRLVAGVRRTAAVVVGGLRTECSRDYCGR